MSDVTYTNQSPTSNPKNGTKKHDDPARIDIVAQGASGKRAEDGLGGQDVDGVWGSLDADGPNYRNLGWVPASVLMTKIQIGLGVLAIPSVCIVLGLVPSILLIMAVGVATGWCQYVIGRFKLQHSEVYSVADVGMIMFGRVGREIFGIIYWIDLTAIAGAGMIGFATALNAISNHGACTVIFVFVAAVLDFIVSSIQTLDRISWIGWIGLFCLMSAIITLTISVGVQDRPDAAPQTGPWDRDLVIIGHPSFLEAMPAVSTIIFSFAGAPNYFGVLAELKKPRDFTKSVIVAQTITMTTYLVVGCTVYHFVGQYVSSPALGSAGFLMKKVCYGLALPGLLVGAVLNTHIPAKYVFIRILGKSRHLTANTVTHKVVWYSCVFFNCAISFILAESIPVFDDIIGFVGAAFATPLSLSLQCLMWLYMWKTNPYRKGLGSAIGVILNATLLAISLFLTVGGAYASGVSISNNVRSGGGTTVFSCADNSGSS